MKKNFFVLTAMIIGSPLIAQERDTISSLYEVVITANKFPMKTSLTGKVLTVITKQQLERSGGKDLSQVLSEQAGIYINGANINPGKDKSVFLQGAPVDHTLITIDGMPVYDPSGVGSNFDIRNIPIGNIERIEILKGSQSTLYGSDALAGVINIITNKKISKPFLLNAGLGYGSNKTFKGNLSLNGRKGILDYDASYSYSGTQGINETLSVNGDKDGSDQHSVQVGFGINPTEKIRMSPFFRFNTLEGELDQGAFLDELDYTYSQDSYQAGIRNEIGIGRTKLYVLYNYNYIKRTYTDDSTQSRNGYDIYSHGSYEGHEHFADMYAVIPLGAVSKLTTGLDLRASQTDINYFSQGYFGPFTSSNSNDSLNQKQLALYSALVLNSKNGLGVELGHRLNIHSEYGSNYVFNLNPFYLIGQKLKVFANLSTGYRVPSLYQLYSEYGNRNLEPESAFTAEGGLHYFAPGNAWDARITGFKRNVKDLIFFYFDPSTFRSQYINQNRQKDYGGDVEFSAPLFHDWTLRTSYSFVSGKIHFTRNGKDTSYNNLIRRPEHSFRIYIGKQVLKNLFISTNMVGVGKRKDTYFDPQTFQEVNVTLKNYFLWDVYAEYFFWKKSVKIFLDVRNILNSDYQEVAGFNTVGANGFLGIRMMLY